MKAKYLILFLLIAVSIGIIISSNTNASEYVSFQQAIEFANSGSSEKFHVVGDLLRDSNGQTHSVVYQPSVDPNKITFSLKDEAGKVQMVVCYDPPPSIQDFYRSEKVVIVGRFLPKDDYFLATKILLKCPSKYQEQQTNTNPS